MQDNNKPNKFIGPYDKIKFSPILIIPLFCWVMLIFLQKKPIILFAASYNLDFLVNFYIYIFLSLGAIGFAGALKISKEKYLFPKKILFTVCILIMLFPVITQILISNKNIDENKVKKLVSSHRSISEDPNQSQDSINNEFYLDYCKSIRENFTTTSEALRQKCEIDKNIGGIIFWELLFGIIYIITVNKFQGKRKTQN